MPFSLQFPTFTPWTALVSLLDIAIIAFVFYRVVLLIRGTRAVSLINGLIVLLIAFGLSEWLQLRTTNWILNEIRLALIVALPIVFQPELRRALEQVGQGRLFARVAGQSDDLDAALVIDEMIQAIMILSRKKIGALIVLERETGLVDLTETGIKIDGLLSAEFLVNIFVPNTPMHDGAVIVRGDRIIAAACFLPLAEAHSFAPEVGSRHRAAVGITEHSDAVAIVVSEETGQVSIANGGKLIRSLDEGTLREMLANLMHVTENGNGNGYTFWPNRR